MENIEYIRKLQKMARKDFANQLGISASHYSRLTNSINSRGASLTLLTNICEITKTNPCLIMCESSHSLRGKIILCKHCILYQNNISLKKVYEKGLSWYDFQLLLHQNCANNIEEERLNFIKEELGIK